MMHAPFSIWRSRNFQGAAYMNAIIFEVAAPEERLRLRVGCHIGAYPLSW